MGFVAYAEGGMGRVAGVFALVPGAPPTVGEGDEVGKFPLRAGASGLTFTAEPTDAMNTIPIFAWSLGGPEVAIIFVLMLLLFGAKKLPELARGMGKSLGEFKRAKQEFEDEIKYGDLQANDSKPSAPTASADPLVSEPAGKQQYPG